MQHRTLFTHISLDGDPELLIFFREFWGNMDGMVFGRVLSRRSAN